MVDNIKEGKEEEFKFDPNKGYKFSYELCDSLGNVEKRRLRAGESQCYGPATAYWGVTIRITINGRTRKYYKSVHVIS
jgi:hypothetical protein